MFDCGVKHREQWRTTEGLKITQPVPSHAGEDTPLQ